MADRLFNRDLVINVGGLRIASRLLDETRNQLGIRQNDITPILKVTFKITKTLKKEPNKASVVLFNLKAENRAALQGSKLPTVIEAGYTDNISQIFSGNLEFAENKKDGRTWITTLQAGDGSKEYKAARINTSLAGPVKVGDMLKTAALGLGINPGNLQSAIERGSLRDGLKELTNGIVMSGKAEKSVDTVAKSMGLGWSIQDGALLFLGPNDLIGDQATVLSSTTGLVGSPEPGDKGIVKARSLLQPNLLPGHPIEINSLEVNGFFRIEKSLFTGDTRGGDWYVDMECKPL